MLEVEHYLDLFSDFVVPKHELLELHRSKISLHYAKAGYEYPTVRLPRTFSKLAGLSARVYQTIYDGSFAFLAVISPTENASKTPKTSVFTRERSPVRIRLGPSSFFKSEARIKAEAENDDYEKLCNVGAIAGDEPLARNMTDRHIVTG